MIQRYKKFIRFLLVAATYNLVGYVFFAVLVYFGVNYLVSSFLAFIFGVLLSFFMNKTLVFAMEKHDSKMIIKYMIFYAILLVINLSILHAFVQLLSLTPYVAQILVTAISAMVSYNMMRLFIFGEKYD